MNAVAAFQLYDLQRREHGQNLLDLPQLRVEGGVITALVGPNGAGKSTLLRVLALLDRPDAGRLEFRGRAVPKSERERVPLRRRITMVQQDPYLFRGTVADNVATGLKLRHEPAAARDARVRLALEQVELSALAQRSARTLSGGEARRLALARALVLAPEVLLLDEPFANVDRRRIDAIEQLIRRVNRTQKTTVVFATHELDQAYRLGDAVIALVGGRLAGPAQENLIHGEIEAQNGACSLILADGTRLSVAEGPVTAHGRYVLPPEAITLSPSELAASVPDPAENHLLGTVVRLELRGDRLRVRVQTETLLLRLERPITEAQRPELTLGRPVVLSFPATALRWLKDEA